MKMISFLSFAVIFFVIITTASQTLIHTSLEKDHFHYCGNITLYDSEIETEFENLKRCHVIEGYLRLHRGSLPQGAKLPNLIQVTDYIILERVENLKSLSEFFPSLAVIRGQNLFFDKYSFILRSNLYLDDIGPWSFSSIMNGAVHVEDNILLCYYKKLDQFVSSSFRRFNFYKNNRNFCPFEDCEEEGYCTVREKTCKSLGLTCANIMERNCSSECIGGCFKPLDPRSCVACKNFEYYYENKSGGVKKCVKKCPAKYLNYMNYRCISYDECDKKNFTVLYQSSKKSENETQKCIKDCPEKFIQPQQQISPSEKKSIRICKMRPVCETTVINNENVGRNLRSCSQVDGNLIIYAAGGKNITQQLEENLKNIVNITGYLKITGANTLYSLNFLSNLKRIEGKRVVNGGQNDNDRGFTFYVVENSNLKQLWDWKFRSKELHINGSVYIHFNDRLCDHEIAKFRKIAKITNGVVNYHTNGINAPCDIFNTHLNAVPGSNGIKLSWMNNYCGLDYRFLYGYQIFYRPAIANISKYEGRDACNDNRVFKRNVVEMKVPNNEPMCLEMDLRCLTPNTRYAIYIESLSVDQYFLIESRIVYATTYADYIEKPRKGKLELTNDGIALSWEHPKLQTYIDPENITYEILLTLDGDLSEDVTKEPEGAVTGEESDCECSSLSENVNFIKKQVEGSIAIANEISGLLFSRRKNNSKRKTRSSSSQTSEEEEQDSSCGLRSRIKSSPPDYKSKACKAMKSKKSDCKEQSVDWSFSSSKFKRAILQSQWEAVKENGVFIKSERTKNTNIFISLPDALNSNLPKNISVQIRACVGEMSPCPPLNISGSCSICSEFLNFVTSTIDDSLPNFEVKLWEENDSSNSRHKPHFVSCSKAPNNPPSTSVLKSSFDILKEIENDKIVDKELCSTSMMPHSKEDTYLLNITWTKPNFFDYILGYRILYYNMDNKKSSVPIYVPKSVSEEKGNCIKIPFETSAKEYHVEFQIHYRGVLGRTNEKCFSINIQNEAPGYLIYLICFVFIVLGALSMFAVYKFSKEIYQEHSKSSKYKETESLNINYEIFQRFEDIFRLDNAQIYIDNDKRLGEGMFGNTYKGTLTKKEGDTSSETVIDVAIKVIKRRFENLDATNDLVEEATKMQKFDCFFIVKLMAIDLKIVDMSPTFSVVMELMDGDLENYLKKLGNNLSQKEMVEILCQVAKGMSYLHEKNFIHRDLAARNCLIRHNVTAEFPLIVKVGDFGLSRILNKESLYIQKRRPIIPVRWTAPEALMNSLYSLDSDVWAFGVLIFEVATRCVHKPYGLKYTDQEVKKKIVRKEIRLSLPPNCSEFLESLLEKCHKFDPHSKIQERPTFHQILTDLTSSKFATQNFLTWLRSRSDLSNCESVNPPPKGNKRLREGNCTVASTLEEPFDNEIDEESDCNDDTCLAPRECSRNQSSCLSINCVHKMIICRKKELSNSEIDDLSFRQNLND